MNIKSKFLALSHKVWWAFICCWVWIRDYATCSYFRACVHSGYKPIISYWEGKLVAVFYFETREKMDAIKWSPAKNR